MGQLHKFEGREVVGAKVKITNAGDGLSQAMAIAPEELKLGRKVFIVLEGEVGKVQFVPVKEGPGVVREQSIRAGVATLVDEELVKEALEAQRIAIEEAAGVTRLDFADPDEEVG